MHTRTIHAGEEEDSLLIEDDLAGHGVHNVELNFQLAPRQSAHISSAENKITCRILGDASVQLAVTGPAGIAGAVLRSSVSTTYGATVAAMKICIQGRAELPARLTTQIAWTEVKEMQSIHTQYPRETNIEFLGNHGP
jgi:hypothetical protein